MKEFATLRPKTSNYLSGNNDQDKKAKGTKKCLIKKVIKITKDYKNF